MQVNQLKSTDIYGALRLKTDTNVLGPIASFECEGNVKLSGHIDLQGKVVTRSYLEELESRPNEQQVRDKIAQATDENHQYTDDKITELTEIDQSTIDNLRQLQQELAENESALQSLENIANSKTSMTDVQSYLHGNYYDKVTTENKLTTAINTSRSYTDGKLVPIDNQIVNLQTAMQNKASYNEMQSYVNQYAYTKLVTDAKLYDTLTAANLYTNTAISASQAGNSNIGLWSAVTALQAEILLKAPKDSPTFTGNVLGINKSTVGLGQVNDTSDASKPLSDAAITALSLKANISNPVFTGNVQGITKAMVGLNNVDNSSDMSKPISNAVNSALNLKANLSGPVFSDNVTVTASLTATNLVASQNITALNANINGTLNAFGLLYVKGFLVLDKTLISALPPSDTFFKFTTNDPSRTSQLACFIANTDNTLNPIVRANDVVIWTGKSDFTQSINVPLVLTCNHTAASGMRIQRDAIQTFGSLTHSGNMSVAGNLTLNGGLSMPNGDFTCKSMTSTDVVAQTSLTVGGRLNFYSGANILSAGTWNPTVQPGDNVLTFNGGSKGTGSLVISQYSDVASGIRITGNAITLNSNCTVNGTLTTSQQINCTSLSSTGTISAAKLACPVLEGNVNVVGTLSCGVLNSTILRFDNNTREVSNELSNIRTLNRTISSPIHVQSFGNNVPFFSCSVPRFTGAMKVVVNVPLANQRSARGMFGGYIVDMYQTLKIDITKNGEPWKQNVAWYNSNIILPQGHTIYFRPGDGNLILKAETYTVYLGNLTIDFLPDTDVNDAVYQCLISYTITSQTTCPSIQYIAQGLSTNTSVTLIESSTALFYSYYTSPIAGYQSPSYSLSMINPTVGAIDNNRVTTMSNPLVAASMTVDQITCTSGLTVATNFRAMTGLCGWLLDGSSFQYQYRPIVGTMNRLFGADSADLIFVNPGYRIITYDGFGFSGFLQEFDNTNQTTPLIIPMTFPNREASLRVWFMGNEVILPWLSA